MNIILLTSYTAPFTVTKEVPTSVHDGRSYLTDLVFFIIMKDSLYDRLWRRECGERSAYSGLRGIYGSKEWVNDLDIVNELGGHTGCVNALRWVQIIAGCAQC